MNSITLEGAMDQDGNVWTVIGTRKHSNDDAPLSVIAKELVPKDPEFWRKYWAKHVTITIALKEDQP